MFKQVLIGLILFCLTLTAWADKLIIEPDMGRTPVINAINDTQHSLDVVMYGLTDESLLGAILQQKLNGKSVKVILEKTPYKAENENVKAISLFKKNGLNWQGEIPPFRLIHQKTLIIDKRKALIMTFNFTQSTFKKERNFALLIDDPKRVNAIENIFAADWNHHAINNTNPELILSPDDSREKIVTLLNQAKKTIKIYAQNISDYKLIGTMAKAARQGIQVDILTSTNMREKQMNYLTRAGVKIHYSKQYYIHAKVILIDNQKAVIGSINFTAASLDNNRELSVITQDPTIIRELNTIFEKDINSADSITAKFMHQVIPYQRTLKHTMRILTKYVKSHI